MSCEKSTILAIKCGHTTLEWVSKPTFGLLKFLNVDKTSAQKFKVYNLIKIRVKKLPVKIARNRQSKKQYP